MAISKRARLAPGVCGVFLGIKSWYLALVIHSQSGLASTSPTSASRSIFRDTLNLV